MGVNWFEDPENVLAVARWAWRHEEVKTAGDVIYLLEKPWKFGWVWDRLYQPPEVFDLGVWEEAVGLENPDGWARVEEEDEDLRPTDLILSDGWIDP